MKKLIVLAALFTFSYATTFAQTAICDSKYYPLKEGVFYEITIYNKKDKPEGVVSYTIKNVADNKATVQSTLLDEKGNEVMSSEYFMFCDENGVSIDFKSLMNNNMLRNYENAEIKMSGKNISIPNKLSVGQELDEANIELEINMAPLTMKMYTRMFNRIVEGKETISTPAGDFNCFIVSHDTEYKMGISKRKSHTKQWLAEGVGVVKTEEYKKKGGKLEAKAILTNFSD